MKFDQLKMFELAQVLGKETVVHVAVDRGPIADRLVTELQRLGGFRENIEL
jgi:hypothetical protein